MANAKGILVYETDAPIDFTVADGASIEKGDFLALTSPMTVALTSNDNDIFGGMAAEEKVASSGITKIAVYRRAIVRVEVGTSGATVGKDATIEAKNEFKDFTATDNEVGYKFGKFLETGADGTFVLMELGA